MWIISTQERIKRNRLSGVFAETRKFCSRNEFWSISPRVVYAGGWIFESLLSALFPAIPMVAWSENNRERNGDEGNLGKGATGEEKGNERARARQRAHGTTFTGGREGSVEAVLVLRLETRSSFWSLLPSFSYSSSLETVATRARITRVQ